MGHEILDDDHPDGDIEIQVVGLRPGEKLYEELLIGENVLGTSHPKVMRAEEESLSYDDMSKNIEDLKSYIKEHNIISIRSILTNTVNGYTPEKDIVDYGYIKNNTESIEKKDFSIN